MSYLCYSSCRLYYICHLLVDRDPNRKLDPGHHRSLLICLVLTILWDRCQDHRYVFEK